MTSSEASPRRRLRVRPRLLTVTWVYWNRPADEVELRLFQGEDGDTVLELEHATVATHAPGDLDGQPVDAILGVGVGWELPLTYSLRMSLGGELPDAPAVEWYEPTPEHEEAANRSGQAWAALIGVASLPDGIPRS